jgi:hypothetical protein
MKIKVIKTEEVKHIANGILLERPLSDFAYPDDTQSAFRRLIRGQLYCEKGVPDVSGMNAFDALIRTKTISTDCVCGVIIDAFVTVSDNKVVVTGTFIPAGPLQDMAKTAMDILDELPLAPRYVLDYDGKIVSVETWDLVELKG